MVLKKLELHNFRLHNQSYFNFSDELNYIIGGNGQGKTTVLEAIYYICTTKSMNQTADSESVTFGETSFEINGFFSNQTLNKVRMFFDVETNKKTVFVDDKQVVRSASIIGRFPVVTLTQSDHAVTLGNPSERRKFFDSVISQSSETYLKILLDYNKTLRQRSSLLSQIKEKPNSNLYEQLDAWTSTVVALGTEIVKHRIDFINRFENYVKDAYFEIMNDKETPWIDYQFLDTVDSEIIAKRFEAALEKMREDEIKRGTNLVGPHRDEFFFKINDRDIRKYGSQGQHKTFQIALRFAQFFFLKDALSRTPVFLMDDIFGELDSHRATRISENLKKLGQAFITMTDFSNTDKLEKSKNDLMIEIREGKIVNA
ncbi:MAG: DNA replication and repair protein RecF [bacterium]